MVSDSDELLSANAELESRRLKVKVWPLEAGCRVTVNSATQLLKVRGIRELARRKAIKEHQSAAERRSHWLPAEKEGSSVGCDKATRGRMRRWWICACCGWWGIGDVLPCNNALVSVFHNPSAPLHIFSSVQVISELKSSFFLALWK